MRVRSSLGHLFVVISESIKKMKYLLIMLLSRDAATAGELKQP